MARKLSMVWLPAREGLLVVNVVPLRIVLMIAPFEVASDYSYPTRALVYNRSALAAGPLQQGTRGTNHRQSPSRSADHRFSNGAAAAEVRIQDIFAALVTDEAPNEFIAPDVIRAVESGRSPLP
jgi:hypothetical protein